MASALDNTRGPVYAVLTGRSQPPSSYSEDTRRSPVSSGNGERIGRSQPRSSYSGRLTRSGVYGYGMYAREHRPPTSYVELARCSH